MAGEVAGLLLTDERLRSTGDAADKAGASDGALQLIARLNGKRSPALAVGLWLRRASAGPTAPRLNGRRHCARSVHTGVSGLAPAPAAAPWFRFG